MTEGYFGLMSTFGSDAAMDEVRASEGLNDLCHAYGINAPAYSVREMFQHRWGTLSRLAHALHNAQVRREQRRGIMATEYEDDTISG